MNKLFRNTAIVMTALIASTLFGACSSAPKASTDGAYASPVPDATGKNLANLMDAFKGESNASAKYAEFAKKADAEGYKRVAVLFRAASYAESVHMKNHAEVIRKLGGNPTAEIAPIEIKTTAENLKGALAGETYERDRMYPEFLTEARRTGNKDALRTFNLAKTAEAEHAKLYAQALANLDAWKVAGATFVVCRTCGFTSGDKNLEKCPIDFTTKENFEVIS